MARKNSIYRSISNLYHWLTDSDFRLYRRNYAQSKAFYSALIREGDLCFDVGANHGDRTEKFLELGARVIAFEPQPKCATILQEKFGHNRNFKLVSQALGARAGKAELFVSNLDNVSSLSSEWITGAKALPELSHAKWDSSVNVPVTTLDEAIQSFGIPKFCKIDVEGYEFEVLRGLSTALPTISFEYSVWRIEPALQCLDLLTTLGTYRFNFSIEETMHFELPELVDAMSIKKMFETQLRSSKFGYGDIYAICSGQN